MKRICAVGLLLVFGGVLAGQSVFAAQAPDPEWAAKADKLYADKKYAEAFPLYEQGAKAGDLRAHVRIGIMYRDGLGTAKNLDAAVEWFRKAATKGNASAQVNLGLAYQLGQGVLKDEARAAHWYRKAADQGHIVGQNNLGALYHAGVGVPQDYEEAARWYQRAAEGGYSDSQRVLGELYRIGLGVAKDPVLAHQWLQKAADRGNVAAKELLAKHQQRVEQLLDIFGVSAVCESTVDSIVKQAVETEPGLAGAEQTIRGFLAKKVGWDALKPEIMRLYMEQFSEAELAEIIGFYESGTGRKFAAASPVISANVMGLVQKTLVQSASEWEAMVAKLLGSAEPK